MDQALRSLEQRLRAAPDDDALLRAVAAARERAGDARGAWRARAHLARVNDAVEDWRALEPPARAPREPAVVRAIEQAGGIVRAGRDGLLLHAHGEGLLSLAPDGTVRWRLPTKERLGTGVSVLPCGPDVVVASDGRLRLVDGAGEAVAEAHLPAAAWAPGGWHDLRITGDRALLWTWPPGQGAGVRAVLDLGERFGAVLDARPAARDAFGAEPGAALVAGRVVARVRDWREPSVGVGPLEADGPAWSTLDGAALRADAHGVLVSAGGDLVERDLRTGEERWRRPGLATRLAARGPEHVVLRDRATLGVHERGQAGALWTARVERAVDCWLVGDAVLVLHHDEDDGRFALSARELATGAERWRAPLPDEAAHEVNAFQTLLAILRPADGALALQVNVDLGDAFASVWERIVWVGEAVE